MPSRCKQRRNRRQISSETSPLEEFFDGYYPEFIYNSSESASLEFYRLCDRQGWKRDDPERLQAHTEFKDALVQQFNRLYGTDADDLADWQNLCCIIRVEPIPDNMEDCREAVRGAHVNLVDLVDTDSTGEEVQVFDTEFALSEYTKSTGKFFPRENAYAGGLLRYLLRHIFNPAREVPSRRKARRRY